MVFEGTSEFGHPFSTRQSYLPREVHWGFQFVQIVFPADPGTDQHSVDIARYPALLPLLSSGLHLCRAPVPAATSQREFMQMAALSRCCGRAHKQPPRMLFGPACSSSPQHPRLSAAPLLYIRKVFLSCFPICLEGASATLLVRRCVRRTGTLSGPADKNDTSQGWLQGVFHLRALRSGRRSPGSVCCPAPRTPPRHDFPSATARSAARPEILQ